MNTDPLSQELLRHAKSEERHGYSGLPNLLREAASSLAELTTELREKGNALAAADSLNERYRSAIAEVAAELEGVRAERGRYETALRTILEYDYMVNGAQPLWAASVANAALNGPEGEETP